MAYKWINERIEKLDPKTDYVEIMRLSSLYTVNTIQLDWLYTVNTIHASISPSVIDAVFRDGEGKYSTDADRRSEDTIDHLVVWFEHGPDAPATMKSLEMVNRSHAHYSKQYPQGLADVDDYLYILCLNGTAMHTVMRAIGLNGHSEKEKQAAHIFWSKLSEHFVAVMDGRQITELKPFPESFDAMVRFVEDYQARSWPLHDPGRRSTHGAIRDFAKRRFPPFLQFFGRALVTTFLCPTVLRVHSVPTPASPLAWGARMAMKIMRVFQTHVLADPAESYPDRRRLRIAQNKQKPSSIDAAVHRSITPSHTAADGPFQMPSVCPHRPTKP